MINVDDKTKRAFMEDNVEKQVRIVFPNDEHETLTNENIMENTLTFTESLSSGEVLKFGLCEASSLKVTVECENDITGCEIEVFIDAYFEDEVLPVSLGLFIVDSCKREAGTMLRKVVAYQKVTKIERNLFDAFDYWKMNIVYPKTPNESVKPFNYEISKKILEEGGISRDEWTKITRKSGVYFSFKFNPEYDPFYVEEWDMYLGELSRIQIRFDAVSLFGMGFVKLENVLPYNNDLEPAFEAWNVVKRISSRFYRMNDDYKVDKTTFKNLTPNNKITPMIARTIVDLNKTPSDYPFYLQSLEMKEGRPYWVGNIGASCYEDTTHTYDWILIPTNITVWSNYDGKEPLDVPVYGYFEAYQSEGNGIKDIPIKLPRVSKKYSINGYEFDGYGIGNIEKYEKLNFFDYMEATAEINGFFGRRNRKNNIDFITINKNFALYPEDTIYPNGNLYPIIGSNNYQPLTATSYKNADYEEYETHKIGYVRVTYLAKDNENYSITVECDPTYDNVYDMTNNFIFLSNVWTADEVKTVIRNNFYPNIKDISYHPASVNIKGLPFIEAGDVIKVYADRGSFKTFVFRRTLSGEQVLTDAIDAKGEIRNSNADAWIMDTTEQE